MLMSKMVNPFVCRFCDLFDCVNKHCVITNKYTNPSDTCDEWEIGDEFNFEKFRNQTDTGDL